MAATVLTVQTSLLRFAELATMDATTADAIHLEAFVKRFEYTLELAKNFWADYLKSKGEIKYFAAKDIIRSAHQSGYMQNTQVWLDAIDMRNKTARTYKEDILLETVVFAQQEFWPELQNFYRFFSEK